MSVLKFAEFLASENNDDVALYDRAKSEDDGYRISSDELRKNMGYNINYSRAAEKYLDGQTQSSRKRIMDADIYKK